MDMYHEQLINHNNIDQLQFNEAYKDKHMLTKFPPAPHVASTFFKLRDSLHKAYPNKINMTSTTVTPLVPRSISINHNK